MKKNLRIVSAAAAALLAVAPVAASAVSVNADTNITNITLGNHHYEKTPNVEVSSHLVAYTTPRQTVINNQTGVATEHLWDGKVNGTISASLDGQSYTANLNLNPNVTIYTLKSGKNGNTISDYNEVKPDKSGAYRLEPGTKYFVRVNNISFNFGSANANRKDILIKGADGVHFVLANSSASLTDVDLAVGDTPAYANGLKPVKDFSGTKESGVIYDTVKNASAIQMKKGTSAKVVANSAYTSLTDNTALIKYTSPSNKEHVAIVSLSDLVSKTNWNNDKGSNVTLKGDTIKASTDQNGALVGTLQAFVQVVPSDVTNAETVNFFLKDTNTEVTTGTLNLDANPTTHELNVNTVLNAAKAKYGVRQSGDKTHSGAHITTTEKDLTDQLTKAGIKVDPLGNFQAPASFSFNLSAESAANKATAALPVTVSVTNGVQTPAAQETTKNVTIMHISTIYDKNGKATHEPALRAYDTYSVVATPVNLKDEKGKDAGMFYKLAGKDQYIKVGNVDGTKRSLKKNSYVYKSTGKAYMKSKKHHRVLKAGSSVTTYGKSFMIAGHQMYRIGKNQYVKKANF